MEDREIYIYILILKIIISEASQAVTMGHKISKKTKQLGSVISKHDTINISGCHCYGLSQGGVQLQLCGCRNTLLDRLLPNKYGSKNIFHIMFIGQLTWYNI